MEKKWVVLKVIPRGNGKDKAAPPGLSQGRLTWPEEVVVTIEFAVGLHHTWYFYKSHGPIFWKISIKGYPNKLFKGIWFSCPTWGSIALAASHSSHQMDSQCK